MQAIGNLMASLNLSVIASAVEGATTVPWGLLLEDDGFREVAARANTMDEVINWVNENY